METETRKVTKCEGHFDYCLECMAYDFCVEPTKLKIIVDEKND
jgi:hypothetical protein